MASHDLLVEIGTEELPPKALKSLAEAFCDGVVTGLKQRNLAHGTAEWFATPRRLAVRVADVQAQAPDRNIEALGPPVERARDEAGEWTPAAIGFARKQGVAPQDLQTIETPKGARLGLRSTEAGVKAAHELIDIINASIGELPIPKRMRWGASREEFVRPAHWIVALLDSEVIKGEVLGLPCGNTSTGHRFHSTGAIAIDSPQHYESQLEAAKVIANFQRRRQLIEQQVHEQATALGATAVIDEALLDEVTGLVEWPVALTGSFEQRFLEVPSEALVSSMKEHQKYFHVVDSTGQLLPNFIAIANIESSDPAQVIAGNERVIRPRLADAAFFFTTDCKTRLADRLPALANVVFQQKLGSLADKSQRVAALAGALATQMGSSAENAQRAGQLAKADLVTDMVLEFPDMQGIAGAYYAANDGEAPEVASALTQQYWPKFAGDRLPETDTARALALADRLDTLVGIFGIGQPPSGSKDPFALRRASLAVLRILVEDNIDLDLGECLQLAVAGYPDDVIAEGTSDKVFDYMVERFRAWYEEDNIPVQVFRAVSSCGLTRPLDIHRRVLAVNAFAQLPEATALAAANKRVGNILDKLDAGHSFQKVSADLLVEPQEIELNQRVEALGPACKQHLSRGEYTEALTALAALREPVDAFFDGVMVNAQDPALRDNRLNLLKSLQNLFLGVADISHLAVGK